MDQRLRLRHATTILSVGVLAVLTTLAIQPAAADTSGTQQSHSSAGLRFSYQWNLYGLNGSQKGTMQDGPGLGNAIAQDLYYNWTTGAPILVMSAQEACAEHLWYTAAGLSARGLAIYQSAFNRTATPVINGFPRTDCTAFGNFVLALGSNVAYQVDYPFPVAHQIGGQDRNVPGQEQRGMACKAANFFGAVFIGCSTHLVSGGTSGAVTARSQQMGDALAYVVGSSPLILGMDANSLPTGAVMFQPGSYRYTEVDSACPPKPSCSTSYTHSTKSIVGPWSRRIDYIFTRSFSPIPRSFVFAWPAWSDHAQVYGYK